MWNMLTSLLFLFRGHFLTIIWSLVEYRVERYKVTKPLPFAEPCKIEKQLQIHHIPGKQITSHFTL